MNLQSLCREFEGILLQVWGNGRGHGHEGSHDKEVKVRPTIILVLEVQTQTHSLIHLLLHQAVRCWRCKNDHFQVLLSCKCWVKHGNTG